jgi:DNA-binding winged helix-turn-helix (wHTH) protein
MGSFPEAPAVPAFGRFLVLPHRRELIADGRPVKLGGRAFDVLKALIEAHGAVVSKDALMARVWPDRIVEENNLHWQISALRAAFGADRNLIRTVSGRGYQFTAEIDIVSGSSRAAAGIAIAVPPDPREAGRDTGGWPRSCRQRTCRRRSPSWSAEMRSSARSSVLPPRIGWLP